MTGYKIKNKTEELIKKILKGCDPAVYLRLGRKYLTNWKKKLYIYLYKIYIYIIYIYNIWCNTHMHFPSAYKVEVCGWILIEDQYK